MRGRLAASLAGLAVACAACEAIVGITDRTATAHPDASGPTLADGPDGIPPGSDADTAVDAGTPDVVTANDSSASLSCAKGGCNAQGGACTSAGTCYCQTDSDCLGRKCVAVAGKNDVSCAAAAAAGAAAGSACTGSGATDGFGCQLSSCVTHVFGYVPSNFSPAGRTPPTTATTDCNGTYSSTTHAFTTGGCAGQNPVIVSNAAQTAAGHSIDILLFQSLTIASASTLSIVGSNPVVLAVYGDATIRGTIDASAIGTAPGAGGNACPTASNGFDAGGSGAWETGGGGAGQAAAGGNGGPSREAGGEPPGIAQGTGPVPLTGGCAGGLPFVGSLGFSPSAGAGGGGVQISAAGVLDFTGGHIKANASNGGNGEPGRCSAAIAQNGTGGAGGGSGGSVVIEGATVAAGTAEAKGGAGGTGGAAPSPNSQGGGDGGAGGLTGAAGAAGGAGVLKGTAPTGCSWGGIWSGGGGGGGGGGYVKTNQGGGACICTADSDCVTGLCSNVSGHCTGTCTGSTKSGTYDTLDCQILGAALH